MIWHFGLAVDKRWIGVDATALFTNATGSSSLVVVNDADAAGYAEMGFGTGKGERGSVLMVTFGTGVGTALFIEEVLVRPSDSFSHFHSLLAQVVEKKLLFWRLDDGCQTSSDSCNPRAKTTLACFVVG
jgi:polyphosphate glucokinase